MVASGSELPPWAFWRSYTGPITGALLLTLSTSSPAAPRLPQAGFQIEPVNKQAHQTLTPELNHYDKQHTGTCDVLTLRREYRKCSFRPVGRLGTRTAEKTDPRSAY